MVNGLCANDEAESIKFPLPVELITKTETKVNANPRTMDETKKSPIPIVKPVNPVDILLKLSSVNYIKELEKYIEETYADQDDFCRNSVVMDNYKKIFKNLSQRFEEGEITLSNIQNKDRMLLLAFRYQQENLATQLGTTMNASLEKLVYLAVQFDCDQALNHLLKNVEKLNFLVTDKDGWTLLHLAALRKLETLTALVNGLGPERIKKLINQPEHRFRDTPVHYIAGRSSKFDDVIKLFVEWGANFKIKNVKGVCPTQNSEHNISSARKALYLSLGITNLTTFTSAIVNNDVEAVKKNLPETPKSKLQAIFRPQNEEDCIKVPVHKPLGGSIFQSTYRPYPMHCIYHHRAEMVKFLIDELLIAGQLFTPEISEEIINDYLHYTSELIKTVSAGERFIQYEQIKNYLQSVISKLNKMQNPNSHETSLSGTQEAKGPGM